MILKHITEELREHAPFTFFGALAAILLISFFRMPENMAYNLFYICHPAHVFLSALTTSAMYQRHKCSTDKKKCNLFMLLAIGYVGSIGVATLSDSLMPFIAETLLKMPHRDIHLGFVEKWWIINPVAFIGISWAYFKPSTKVSHFGHVLLSTWASLFHVLMAQGGDMGIAAYLVILVFLFLAVWIPCCFSDIVFPLLFIKPEKTSS